MSEVEFCVLGAVEAVAAGGPIDLGPPRQRAVLAVLLVDAGRVVPADQLVHRVWGEPPPVGARASLSSYISRLRGLLSGSSVEIPRRHGGYLLDIDPAAVDMHRYHHVVQRARSATDDAQALTCWREAIAMWQGDPFADLDVPWLDQVAARLTAQHQAALADYRDLQLRHGGHAELIPELQAAAGAHPLDERVATQLMLALYRNGRQADALTHYDQLRHQLADQLGSDPAPASQRLHRRMLSSDPELAAPAAPELAPRADPDQAPVTLPWDTSDFTGRRSELDQLHACAAAPRRPGTAAMVLIFGGGGAGKTALAVHWAHQPQTADRFPDGRLYVNLRGFSDREPLGSADVLRELLQQLGVPGPAIPSDIDRQQQLYRQRLAGRRVLIILDNAAESDQVRPVLIGAPGLAVVTSRSRLTGLSVQIGVSGIALGRLPESDATTLAVRLLDDKHHPAGTARLSAICARLPLAIRLAANGFRATHPDASLASYLDQLEGDRIGLLDAAADDDTAITNVLSGSVQRLAPELVRAYRLIGLHPGPRMDIPAIAALLGTDERQCRRAVRKLAGVSLLEETSPDWWSMHDLLAEHARDSAGSEAGAAQVRLIGHYLDRLAAEPIDHRWLNEERAALQACLRLPVAAEAIVRYGLRLGDQLYKVDLYADARHTYEVVRLRCPTESPAYAQATFGIGRSAVWLDEPDAEPFLDEALRRFQQLDDVRGEARTLRELAELNRGKGRHQEDLDLRALGLFRRAGDLEGESDTLMALALESASCGNYSLARERATQALDLAHRAGSPMRQGDCHRALGDVALRTGDHAAAAEHLTEADRLFAQAGSQLGRGYTLMGLGAVASAAGDHRGAMAYQREALAVAAETGARDAEAHVYLYMGRIALAMDDPVQAREHLTRALHLNRQLENPVGIAFNHLALADVLLDTGEPAAAAEQYRQVAADLTRLGYPKGEAEARLGLGRALAATGDAGQAREQLEAALGQFEKLGLPEAAQAQAALQQIPPTGAP